MIDYTQHAFAAPPDIFDPSPSVADYLDDYSARNEAWYQRWAHPLEGGGYGARPSSFERRGAYIAPPPTTEVPAEVLPPVLRNLYGNEDTRVDDRPAGAMYPDLYGMSDDEVIAYHESLNSPAAKAAPYGIGLGAGLLTGVGTPFGYMAGEGLEKGRMMALSEMLARESMGSRLPDLAMVDAGGGGTTGPDLSPEYSLIATLTPQEAEARETGTHQRDQAQGGLGDWDDETGFGGA